MVIYEYEFIARNGGLVKKKHKGECQIGFLSTRYRNKII